MSSRPIRACLCRDFTTLFASAALLADCINWSESFMMIFTGLDNSWIKLLLRKICVVKVRKDLENHRIKGILSVGKCISIFEEFLKFMVAQPAAFKFIPLVVFKSLRTMFLYKVGLLMKICILLLPTQMENWMKLITIVSSR